MSGRRPRPLTCELKEISIGQLKAWDLLQVGCETTRSFDNGVAVATDLASRQPSCLIYSTTVKGPSLQLELDSRRLGTGLVWYFIDPASGDLCTKLHYSVDGLLTRKAAGAVYLTQYQDKGYRKLKRIADWLFRSWGIPTASGVRDAETGKGKT
jgi:hypothetical protein